MRIIGALAALACLGTPVAAQDLFSPAIVVGDRAVSGYEVAQRTLLLDLFGTPGDLAETAREELQAVYSAAYAAYERLTEAGVARELARAVMPVGAYTEFFWTVNARALMNFISLRNTETAQREIRRYAEVCEGFLETAMPVTHGAFVAAGRVAP